MKSCWIYLPIVLLTTFISCGGKKSVKSYSPTNETCSIGPSSLSSGNYFAPKASEQIQLDGKGEDSLWENAPWREIKYRWKGNEYSTQDFQGRYKILWDKDHLYFLVEIVDNILSDQHRDPLEKYWQDDGVKISIRNPQKDTGKSNLGPVTSFVLAINGDVIELGANGKSAKLVKESLRFKRTNSRGYMHTWEVIYPMNMSKDKLLEGDLLGYAVSYYDNDGKRENENTIGSIANGETAETTALSNHTLGKLELIE